MSCDGAATQKAARRLSKPTRATRRASLDSTSTSRRARRGLGPDAAVHPGRFHEPRCGGRARRLRHRSERHRRQLRRAGSRLAVTIPYYQFREILTVRDADAATLSHAHRSARPSRGDARRHARVRSARRLPSRSRRRPSFRTRTMCIRIPTWHSGSRGCGPAGRRTRGAGRSPNPGLMNQPTERRRWATTSGSLAPENACASRSR